MLGKLKNTKNKKFKDTKHIKHHHRMCPHFSKIQLPPCKGIETMCKFIVDTLSHPW